MKKILPVALVLIVLAGVGFYVAGKQRGSQVSDKGGNVLTSPETAPQTSGNDGVISSIKDAMGLGQKMQCTYTSGAGATAVTSTVFVDGQKFRSESEVYGTKVYALFDGDMQYTWMSNTKQGTKMSKTCLDDVKQSLPQGSTDLKTEDYAKTFDMANNVNCGPATGADFTVPSDITFIDQCVMMKESLKRMQDLKDKMPAGSPSPQGVPSAY